MMEKSSSAHRQAGERTAEEFAVGSKGERCWQIGGGR